MRSQRIATIGIALLLATSSALAATKKPASSLPALLQEVETKYAKAATLVAEFSQTNHNAALRTDKKSAGMIMLKRPNKLRWETIKPDPNLLVSDGKTFWFYTPPFDEGERGQVMVKKTSEVQSKLANALLGGSFSVASEMKIKKMSAREFRLTPKNKKKAGSGIAFAEIQVDPEKKLIQKVILEHVGGNRTEIGLTKIELGKDVPEDLFKFTPPSGTDSVESATE